MNPVAMAPEAGRKPGRPVAVGDTAPDERSEIEPVDGPETHDAHRLGAARRVRLFSLIALCLVAGAAMLAFLPERIPSMAPVRGLEMMPSALGAWREASPPPDRAMPADAAATHQLSRTYTRGGDTVWLSITYYAALGAGRHPQVQQLVMPGHGYLDLRVRTVDVPLGREMLPANLVVMRTPDRIVATLYWYHLNGRGVASDHGYRALLFWNRLWRQRSNVAVIRVASPLGGDGSDAAVAAASAAQADFVRALYPELRRSLPE